MAVDETKILHKYKKRLENELAPGAFGFQEDITYSQAYRQFKKEQSTKVHTIFERLYYIYTHNILERDKIITMKEIKKYIKVKKLMNKLKRKSNFILEELDENIFYYKHGLKYVPDNVGDGLKNKDFIDGGAYIGDSALMFEKYYQPGTQ